MPSGLTLDTRRYITATQVSAGAVSSQDGLAGPGDVLTEVTMIGGASLSNGYVMLFDSLTTPASNFHTDTNLIMILKGYSSKTDSYTLPDGGLTLVNGLSIRIAGQGANGLDGTDNTAGGTVDVSFIVE